MAAVREDLFVMPCPKWAPLIPYQKIAANPQITPLGWDLIEAGMEKILDDIRKEDDEMGFKKHGTGEVTETEGPLSRTASAGEFSDADREALARENEQADGKEQG